jgi:hypothetical protein
MPKTENNGRIPGVQRLGFAILGAFALLAAFWLGILFFAGSLVEYQIPAMHL